MFESLEAKKLRNLEKSGNLRVNSEEITVVSNFYNSLKTGYKLKNLLPCHSTTLSLKSKAAFTLAEVLITLGIIGVVAAITLPIMINNYKKQVTVTQLRKAYSELSQALQKAESERGLMETWSIPLTDFETKTERNIYFAENYLLPHLKTIKTCFPTSNECWADGVVSMSGKLYQTLSNDKEHASFISASGYNVFYWLHTNGYGMHYWVDLNGFKKPNEMGKDIFDLQVDWGPNWKGKIMPYGANNPISDRSTLLNPSNQYACVRGNNVNNGYLCGALIMFDGWKISDDYPW